LRQFATRPVQDHPDAAFSETKRGRYLAMVGAFDIGQPHQLTLLRSEPREHTRHVKTQWNIGAGRTARVQRLVSAPELMTPTPPIMVDGAAGHAKEKSAHLLRIVSARRRSYEPQISLLHDVVGVRRIPEHTRGVRPQTAGRPAIQRVERLFVDHA